MKSIAVYILNILVAVDQLANTILGGDPDETISSRAAKAQRLKKPWGCVLCKFLDLFQKGHCDKSIEWGEGADAVRWR